MVVLCTAKAGPRRQALSFNACRWLFSVSLGYLVLDSNPLLHVVGNRPQALSFPKLHVSGSLEPVVVVFRQPWLFDAVRWTPTLCYIL